ncbi:MAG: hypothetical protein HFI73_01595 [Bacilli bacterium]|jgi:hypothetical protein|nr:hypothetical protein [Bacilli bacterium]
MNDNASKVKELEFEKVLWWIVIFLSALNIYGDNLEQLFFKNNNIGAEKKAKKIFIFTITVSLIIYLYYVYRNYKYYSVSKFKRNETFLYLIRLIGSIFVVVGVIFILYYEVKEKTPVGTPTI